MSKEEEDGGGEATGGRRWREEKEDSLCAALREGVAPMLFMRTRRKVTSVSCQSEQFGVKG